MIGKGNEELISPRRESRAQRGTGNAPPPQETFTQYNFRLGEPTTFVVVSTVDALRVNDGASTLPRRRRLRKLKLLLRQRQM